MRNYKPFLLYLFRFLGIFAVLYGGTLLIIGLAAPGGYYSPFVANHLDYVSGLKRMIVANVSMLTGWFGYETAIEPAFIVRIVGKRGVVIAMDCVGYGVFSFWIAYVISNSGSWIKKMAWVIGGLLLLWSINISRITLFLISINKNQPMPLGIDHHTWFNIFSYTAIFLMIWMYERNQNTVRR